jgi:hypothetical protein
LGFVAATQHKEAAIVRRFSEFQWTAATGDDNAAPLMDFSLLDALTAALQPPLWIVSFVVNTTTEFCHLTVCDGWVTVEVDGAKGMWPGPRAEYWFKDPTALPLHAPLCPVQISRTIDHLLIGRLLTDLMHHPVPPDSGEAHPITKDAGPSPKRAGAHRTPRPRMHSRKDPHKSRVYYARA